MLATVVLSVAVFAVVLAVLFWVRTPRYRIERENVIALLRLVLAHRASENDWRVFVSVPLRNNPLLDEVRERCAEIEEREYLGHASSRSDGALFTDRGMAELRELLEELEAEEKRVEESEHDKK